jgi:hypothetical protein
MPLQHGVRGLGDSGLRRDGDDWSGHDLMGAHLGSLWSWELILIGYPHRRAEI